jgi:hypothetical protein
MGSTGRLTESHGKFIVTSLSEIKTFFITVTSESVLILVISFWGLKETTFEICFEKVVAMIAKG